MKAKKVINNFDKLAQHEQEKELKKLAKRANVRLALLEKTGEHNEAYNKAQYHNNDTGRIKNRFYEGTRYKSKEDIQSAYDALSNFLNAPTSTLGGIKNEVEKKVERMLKEEKFDYNTLHKMTKKEKIYASQAMSKVANKRLSELEKNDIDYYAYASVEHYNKSTGRKNNRFYRGSKFKTERDLNIHLQNEVYFLRAKSSTLKGIHEIYDQRVEKFREKGLNIPKGKEQEFYDFLSSAQFEALKKYADSNQTLETFVEARNKKVDIDKINEEFQNFMNDEITEDELQERLNVAKWNGGLLK